MISEALLHDFNVVLQAQRRITRQAGNRLVMLEDSALARSNDHSKQICSLDRELREIETAVSRLPADALDDWSPDQVLQVYEKRERLVHKELSSLQFHDWNQFTKDSIAYAARNGSEGVMAWEAFLTSEDLDALRKESKDESQPMVPAAPTKA